MNVTIGYKIQHKSSVADVSFRTKFLVENVSTVNKKKTHNSAKPIRFEI